jgi:hypothetical protein
VVEPGVGGGIGEDEAALGKSIREIYLRFISLREILVFYILLTGVCDYARSATADLEDSTRIKLC